MDIQQTIIRFPEIKLQTRDAHKLRGYFGNLFREKSALLHNHLENGEFRYAYPQVQYKVIHDIPTLVGISEGAELLQQLFMQMRELHIDQKVWPVNQKNIEDRTIDIGVVEMPLTYRFESLWMALNQQNHVLYKKSKRNDMKRMLEKTLVGNCLSFFKSMDLFVEKKIMASVSVHEKITRFKNNRMIVFDGEFQANVLLPDYIGIGKQVARGFGTIKRLHQEP